MIVVVPSAAPLRPPVPSADVPVRAGPDRARKDGAAAFLATLAEYEGWSGERLERD